MIRENFIRLFEKSFKKNWDKPACVDYISGDAMNYSGFATEIEKRHILFSGMGLKEGDVIAVSGKNSTAWAVAYTATLMYGAVVVPILDEFNPLDITHIINHSETKLFFVDDDLWKKLDSRDFKLLQGVVSLNSKKALYEKEEGVLSSLLESLDSMIAEKYPEGYSKNDIKYAKVSNDKLAVLCYTSGTTSMTKGVMLTYNNLCGNVLFARNNYQKLKVELKSTICLLPLAHTYGTAFTLLVQMQHGARMVYLSKVPSPNVVMEACAKYKPTLLFFVPLVFEKIYKSRIEPILKKPVMKFLLATPLIGKLIYRSIGRKLYKMFGGELEEVIIGGAAMNQEVELFFKKAGFPFLVGYGMTECGPLISYIHNRYFIPTSVGRPLKGLMDVRIVKESSLDDIGEIEVKGENVMLGYYKDPEQSAATFSKDGWLKTGDLGKIDNLGNIYIMGRSKTMLLGPSGENIYPEPIELKLANMPFILECIIVQHKNRLEAWVYPDFEAVEANGLTEEDLARVMEDNRKSVNLTLARFEAVNVIRVTSRPFPKTPKRTIKRYSALEAIMRDYEIEDNE